MANSFLFGRSTPLNTCCVYYSVYVDLQLSSCVWWFIRSANQRPARSEWIFFTKWSQSVEGCWRNISETDWSGSRVSRLSWRIVNNVVLWSPCKVQNQIQIVYEFMTVSICEILSWKNQQIWVL